MEINIVEYFKALEKELPKLCEKLDTHGYEVMQHFMQEWFIGVTMQMHEAHASKDKG